MFQLLFYFCLLCQEEMPVIWKRSKLTLIWGNCSPRYANRYKETNLTTLNGIFPCLERLKLSRFINKQHLWSTYSWVWHIHRHWGLIKKRKLAHILWSQGFYRLIGTEITWQFAELLGVFEVGGLENNRKQS